MSRKHYIAAAESFARQMDGATPEVRQALTEVASDLAVQFKRDNPAFDRARFLTAAGVHP